MKRFRSLIASALLVAQTTSLVAAPLAEGALSASDFDQVYARYVRGEISLAEVEEARKAFQKLSVEQAVVRAPSSGDGESLVARDGVLQGTGDGTITGGPLPEAGAAGEAPPPAGKAGTLGKIASWIRDIPRRTVRRFFPGDRIEDVAQGTHDIDNSPVPAYTANAAQREADSDWKRPVTVTAKAEINKVQSVLERVIGFGGLAALAKALAGDKTAIKAVNAASAAVKKMTPSQRATLTRTLSKTPIKAQIAQFIGGKPTSGLGKIVKDQFGNNMILAVAASTLAGVLLNDGLDLDTLKDNLVALNAIESRRTVRENLIGIPLETVAFYHMDRFAGSVFDKLWTRVSSGAGGIAGWVNATEKVVTRFGDKIVKHPPTHLAAKAAELGRSASSLGLPGVTGATQLTLRGAAEGLFKAGTLGVIGIPLINGAWKVVLGHAEGMYLGGNRSKVFARYDLHDTYFQRTGNKFKDAVEERKWATLNFIENHEKFPFTNFLNYFFRMAGGYVGAVVASSLFAPVSLPTFGAALVVSAIFSEGGVAIGNWLGAKLDTSPAFYRRLRKKNARRVHELALDMDLDLPERRRAMRALAALDRARSRMGIRSNAQVAAVMEAGGPPARELTALAAEYRREKEALHVRIAEVADQRADDYEALMKVSQVNGRIKFVESFDKIRISQKDGYSWIETPGFSGKAMPRYDFVTADGRRGVWDYRTNRVIDVGVIREQNGNRIAFLDDAGVKVRDGVLVVLDDPENNADAPAGTAAVSKNGVILEKGPKGEWLARGYGGEYDIVLRESGRRFAWDGERFNEVTSEVRAAAAAKADEAKDPKTREFSAKLVASLAEKGAGSVEGDAGLVHDALRDIARIARKRASH